MKARYRMAEVGPNLRPMWNSLSFSIYSNKTHDPVHCLISSLWSDLSRPGRQKDSEAGTVLLTSQLFFFFFGFWYLQSQLIKKETKIYYEWVWLPSGHKPMLIYSSSRGQIINILL
ncbi:hypothetical protein GDO78_020974 [Eleutherodactylus coqui]|uniref:Uncharacterized protein n=1 Tax=Eleutherodactylus coqui TaxID=57060 RepID=A0A8J6EHM5_ELECQ|nr:hypothetical protein GDO78_020974 [Eleutherodactylus coqui]